MKIGFLITARLKSSRLKQKILLDLNGKSVVERVIDRAKKVKGIDGIVLCTSVNAQDSVLYDVALDNKIKFFAGSEDDVLNRLLNAAEYFGFDAFVSITADNPLFSIHTSNILVDMYKRAGYDFINTKGLPIGCGTYFLDVNALKIVNHIKKQTDTEIWGPYINRPDFFNVADLKVMNSPYDETLRITLDYPEDYYFIRKLYYNYPKDSILEIMDVFDIIAKDPSILDINKKHKQLALREDIVEKINLDFQKNKSLAIEFAKSINKKVYGNYHQESVYL